MSKSTIMITAFAAIVCFGNLAKAEMVCKLNVRPISEIYSNETTKAKGRIWAGRCPHKFETKIATVTSAHIVKSPKNGKLVVGDDLTVRYFANKDYKGIENYAIKYCGYVLDKKGCTTFDFDMIVE